MSDSAIIIVFLIGTCLGMSQAVLMLVSPVHHRRFNNWVSTLGRHSQFRTVDELPNRPELRYRFAGLLLFFVCTGLAWAAVNALRESTSRVTPATPIEHAQNLGANWLPFVIGPVVIVIGAFIALRPSAAMRWSRRFSPIRSRTLVDDNETSLVMILFGLCFVGFGVFMLWLGVHNFPHTP